MACKYCRNTGKGGEYEYINYKWVQGTCPYCDKGDKEKERQGERLRRDFNIPRLGD